MRLGVYADLVYRRDGDDLSTDLSFVLFVAGLASRVDELVVFGRLDPAPGRAPYVLPPGVRFVPLPHYASVAAIGALVGSVRGALAAFRRELDGLDAVWLFGPHPLSLAFALAAKRRGVRVFLGVRQDFPEYVRRRLPSRRWLWAVAVAHALERIWRRLGPAVVVGDELALHYPDALATGFSLIRADDVQPQQRSWDGDLRLLSVGRLDPEKNPLLLAEVLARLPQRWRLAVVGTGPLAEALQARAEELGVTDRIELLGYVALGDDLWEQYRTSDAFLHVSFTEGLPQVLFEAQAAGLPIVATDVGGVRAALGETGLLIGPDDAEAAVAALERLAAEPELRERLAAGGVESVRRETMDAQLERIVAFFQSRS